jgi:Protein of unknown function (DUF998)
MAGTRGEASEDVTIPNRIRSGLLGAGAAAGPLFVGTFIVLGSRKAGYDAQRHPISSLALGQGGWLQRANFVTTGSGHWNNWNSSMPWATTHPAG